jgi:hypothetical protein
MGARVVNQRVLEDPAHARGVRPQLGPHPIGQLRLDLGEVLDTRLRAQ